MLHTLTVYVHLIAACSAIGVIIISDIRLSHYFFGQVVKQFRPDLSIEIKIIVGALGILWLSGIYLVYQGLITNPEYLLNQKLQAKIILVIALTINAFALHLISLPRIFCLEGHDDFVKTVFPASISNSVWFYAAFLGVARHWNFSESLEFILAVWIVIWLIVFFSMYFVIRAAKSRLVNRLEAASALC